jgi:DNA-directed RNA polymerase specialized sigma24 family protein
MQAEELMVLVDQARRGNSQAFIDIMASAQRDLRVFIGTFACSAILAERVFSETISDARRQLIDCPATPAIFTWLRQLAAAQLATRLDEERRSAQSSGDQLSEVLAAASEASLQAQAVPSNSAGQSVGVRYTELAESSQQLISSRYTDGLFGQALCAATGMDQAALAGVLFAVRRALDWKASLGVVAFSPALPVLVEGYLSGRLGEAERAALAEEVGRSEGIAALFILQVRIDRLLHALFGPLTRDLVQQVVARLGAGHESSRLMMGPPPTALAPATPDSPGGGRRMPGRSEVRRHSGVRSQSPSSAIHNKPHSSSIHNPRQPARAPAPAPAPAAVANMRRSGQQRIASAAALPLPAAEDDAPPASRTPLYLALGALAVGLIAIVAIWAGSSAHRATIASGPPGPSAPAVGSAFAHIERAIGEAVLIQDGKRRGASVGDQVAAGAGAQTAAGAVLSLQLEQNQLHLTLSGDSQIDQLTEGARPRVLLDHGRLDIAAVERTTASQGIEVVGSLARVVLEPGKSVVTAGPGRVRLEVTEGSGELARADGGAALRLHAGQSASLTAHSDPVLDGSTLFVRGIAFGGGAVSIGGNPFLAKGDALLAGLSLAPGMSSAPPGAISGPHLDFDLKAMLDSGLTSAESRVHFTQVLPNGTFDVQLWIANEKGVGATPTRISLQGEDIPLATIEDGSATWRALGPYRTMVAKRSLDVQVDGLGQSRLCGVAFFAVGHPSGGVPPLVTLASPLSGSEVVGEVALLARVVGASEVTRVAFLNGDQVIAQVTSEPYRAVWQDPPPGKAELRVQVTDGSGATVLSAPTIFTVKDSLAPGLIRREIFNNIGGGSVSDLTGNAAYPDHPSTVTYDAAFFFPENQVPNYGTRMRGYLHPPATGEYQFWIAGDDNCELWLSSDQSSAHKRLIARVATYTGFQDWTHEAGQRSDPVTLQGGQLYYIEALHKQGQGGAHLAVGWRLPDGTLERPIPGRRLSILASPAGAAPVAEATTPTPVLAATPAATPPAAPAPASAPVPVPVATPVPVPIAVTPRFVYGIKLGGGNAVTIDGNKWVAQGQAETAGLVVKNGRATSLAMEPKPAVDAGMRAMLANGITASGGPLELVLHLPNGTYQVYAWYMETTLASARSFDLEINGELLPGLGGLAVGSWSRYGPCEVGVRNAVLDIVAKAKKGAPLLMGVAVFATFDPAALARAFPAGAVRVLPCAISCADYDLGGEGVGYHDTDDRNEGGKYRKDGVDIDDKPGGGYMVGWVHPGEWMNYTVLAAKTGNYTLALRAGSPHNGASVHIEIDGVNVTGKMDILNTGDYKKFAEVVKNGIAVTQGVHVVRLVADKPGANRNDLCNYDNITFTAE